MRADRRSAFIGRARCSGVFAGSKISRAGFDGFFQGTTTVREVTAGRFEPDPDRGGYGSLDFSFFVGSQIDRQLDLANLNAGDKPLNRLSGRGDDGMAREKTIQVCALNLAANPHPDSIYISILCGTLHSSWFKLEVRITPKSLRQGPYRAAPAFIVVRFLFEPRSI